MTTASTDTHRAAPPAPSPTDFLGIDALLNDDERLIRDTVRAFVRDRVLPNIAEWFEDHTFPQTMAKELGDLGLLGMHLQGYGCAGTSAVAYGLACLELEAGDSGFRSVRVGARVACDVRDLGARLGRAETDVAAAHGCR